MLFSEFDLINNFLNKEHSSTRNDVILGIGDDCALVTANKEKLVVISTDTLVSGIHFLPNISPIDLGYKSLAVNLSDLAAMGADPAWLTLALTLPYLNKLWIHDYTNSLFKQLNFYNIKLVGGDVTCGPLSLTMTIIGLIPIGCRILSRSNAHIGDLIYVTGTLGDSAAGLAILQNNLEINHIHDRQYLVMRHLRPNPRIAQGQILRTLANSAIDLSDGIISDLNHIIVNSHCSARIYVNKIPCSSILKKYTTPEQALNFMLSGGEDYELCFTVSEDNLGKLNNVLNNLNVQCTCIGQIEPYGKGLQIMKYNKLLKYNVLTFDHFKKN